MEQKTEQSSIPVVDEEPTEQERTSVFRQKSIDRISSPEQLNDYIRVASPRMWVVLAAIVIFLAGMIVWAVFGHIESTVNGVAIVDDGVCTLYVPQSKVSLLKSGDPVTVDDQETSLSAVSSPFTVPDDFPEFALSVGGFSEGEWICSATVQPVELADGIYSASVVEESISPISFLTDKD